MDIMLRFREGVRENNNCWHDSSKVWPGIGLLEFGIGVLLGQ